MLWFFDLSGTQTWKDVLGKLMLRKIKILEGRYASCYVWVISSAPFPSIWLLRFLHLSPGVSYLTSEIIWYDTFYGFSQEHQTEVKECYAILKQATTDSGRWQDVVDQTHPAIVRTAYMDAWKKYHKTACKSLLEGEQLDVRNISKAL